MRLSKEYSDAQRREQYFYKKLESLETKDKEAQQKIKDLRKTIADYESLSAADSSGNKLSLKIREKLK